ncbi:hypothetical protein JF50_20185 [Pseudoalteromonas luteoviolacea]|uniref:Uncharacterized protein n=1 Tax=Pseudoalteromonas luteoviolacea TaxID=43657 RepID=A0A0C1MFF7_9GAMM|nr:hypothetical protein [Pseudoalteromonas luteoviolacea]KID55529.1 hypothetical protein JF50_20185 [Pseudoalteromonas luteoviolacea]
MEKKLQFKAMSSAPEKALVAPKSVYTSNLVQKVDIDCGYFNEHFDFGYIEIHATSKAEYRELVIESSAILNKSGSVLSSFHYKKGKAHFFMTKKGESGTIVCGNVSLKVTCEELPFINPRHEFIQMILISNALPSLMSKEIVSERRAFYNNEKYYRAAYSEHKENGVNVVVCIESKISPDWTMSANNVPSGNIFNATTVTFTLLSDVEKFVPRSRNMAKRKAKMLNGEQFKLGEHGFVVPTKKGGKTKSSSNDVYVKGSIEDYTNNRTDAYVIDHDKIKMNAKGDVNESSPDTSRAAHAYTFLDDLSEIYAGSTSVAFGRTEFDRCYSGVKLKTKSNNEYKAIMQVLSEYNIRIVNKTTDKTILPEHIAQLEELSSYSYKIQKCKKQGNIKYLIGEQKNTDGKPELILLVTEGEGYYRRHKGLEDPYADYKSTNPDKIIQSVEYGSLFRTLKVRDLDDQVINEVPLLAGREYKKEKEIVTGGCAMLDCLLAQLHLKLEVHSNQLFIDRKTGKLPEDFSFIYPFRVKTKKNESSDDEVTLEEGEDLTEEIEGEDTPFSGYRYCAVTTDSMKLKFEELSESKLEDIQYQLGGHCHLVFGKKKTSENGRVKYTHHRHPFMFNFETGHYMVFVRTSANAMPDHEKLETYRHSLIAGRKESVSRSWFKEYITRSGVSENVVNTVTSMLESSEADCFYYHQVRECFKKFKPRIGKRLSNNDKNIILYVIEQELGIRWYSGIKTSEMKDLVAHQEGFMFSRSDKCYCAGSVGSFRAGSQEGFSKIYKLITNFGLIEDMDHWFLSMSVRNRQTTVYPFIFQHAKEYASMTQFETCASDKPKKVEPDNDTKYANTEYENYDDIDF